MSHKNFNEKLRSTPRASDEEFSCEPVAKHLFLRLTREIESWEVCFKEHCTKRGDSWSTAVLHTTGVQIDKVCCFLFTNLFAASDKIFLIFILSDSKG
jgi:hypothetical protein